MFAKTDGVGTRVEVRLAGEIVDRKPLRMLRDEQKVGGKRSVAGKAAAGPEGAVRMAR